jgi:hypothetical protein
VARAYLSHLVTDYGTWRPMFDTRMPKLADVGVTVVAVFRDTADPNVVLASVDSDRLVGEVSAAVRSVHQYLAF